MIRIVMSLEEKRAVLKLGRAAAALKAGNADAEDRSVEHVLPVAVSMAPKRTGRLASSLRTGRDEQGATVVSSLRYAYYRHWGSRKNEPDEFLLDAALDTREQWELYFRALLERAVRA